jgi:hypothetical protein
VSFKAKSLLAWPLSALPETSCKLVFEGATGGEIQPVAFTFSSDVFNEQELSFR